jgi:hypothetical protein
LLCAAVYLGLFENRLMNASKLADYVGVPRSTMDLGQLGRVGRVERTGTTGPKAKNKINDLCPLTGYSGALIANGNFQRRRPSARSCSNRTMSDRPAHTLYDGDHRTVERWCHRQPSSYHQLLCPADAAKAEAYFERALAVARSQQAKSFELRVAMSMSRLWREQGKRDEARDLLASVYAGSPRALTRWN